MDLEPTAKWVGFKFSFYCMKELFYGKICSEAQAKSVFSLFREPAYKQVFPAFHFVLFCTKLLI